MLNSNAVKMLLNVPDTLTGVVRDIGENPWWQNIFYISMAFFLPLQWAVWFLFGLVIMDTIASIYRQIKSAKEKLRCKLKRPLTWRERQRVRAEVFEPKKIGTPIEKLVVYIMVLMMFFVADVMLFKTDPADAGGNLFSLTNGVLMLLAGREITSFLGHAFEITHLTVFKDISRFFKKYQKDGLDRISPGQNGKPENEDVYIEEEEAKNE